MYFTVHTQLCICMLYIYTLNDGGAMLFSLLTVDTVDIDRDNDTDNGEGGGTH
jgi:hypothetical protein